jgi:hypothetical protein
MLWCAFFFPDVSHSVNVVSSDKVLWPTIKLILCYLWDATNIGLVFNRGSNIGSSRCNWLIFDSDYVGDLVVTQGDIALEQIVHKENPVNMLTKLILVLKFKNCLDLIVACNVAFSSTQAGK